ncbi:MAG: heme o synthase [Rickettsiales bacterium]|jgi:protoheme IX farnesyltransferase|nr:heme o synthase [Rickettsiales bacterium]
MQDIELESRVRDYFNLLKPRVMSLVVFTGITGLYLAPGEINLFIAAIAILCISVGSGAAGAINMWYDEDIDNIMSRTKKRPIPSGRVAAEDALYLGVFLSCAAVALMGLAVNILSALLLAFTIFFYCYIYTVLLKRSTPQNIVIGGAAGALPPLIGWVAVTNQITIEPIILFLIIFFWTPPHFWALSLYRSDDYKKANIPMMPVVSGIQSTKMQILIYTVLLFIISILPFVFHFVGNIYLYTACVLNLIFLAMVIALYLDFKNKIAGKVFAYSILYLFVLFLSAIIDKAWSN